MVVAKMTGTGVGLNVDPCDGRERTWQLTLTNNTDQRVDIWFAQVRAVIGNIAPGYVDDTGIFVASVGIDALGTESIDPCIAGGRRQACQGNEITGSVKMIDSDNKETDVTLERATSEPNSYLTTVGWQVHFSYGANGKRRITSLRVTDQPDETIVTNILSPFARVVPFLQGDPAWLCLWNSNAQTLYFSLRYDTGAIDNFNIEPGGSHRVFVGNGQGMCYYGYSPIPANGGPNGFFIQESAGNCPVALA